MVYVDSDFATSMAQLIEKVSCVLDWLWLMMLTQAELFKAGKPGGEDPQVWDIVWTGTDDRDMLDQHGEPIAVTSQNLAAYVRWQVAQKLTLPIQQELAAMREGMLKVVPESVLTGLAAEDLQILLSGRSTQPTIEDLKKMFVISDRRHEKTKANAESADCESNQRIALADFEAVFWEMLQMMESDEIFRFVAYVTGSPVLHSRMEIHLIDPPEHAASGPFARQCMSYVTVPCCVWGEHSPAKHDPMTPEALLTTFRNAMALATEFDTV